MRDHLEMGRDGREFGGRLRSGLLSLFRHRGAAAWKNTRLLRSSPSSSPPRHAYLPGQEPQQADLAPPLPLQLAVVAHMPSMWDLRLGDRHRFVASRTAMAAGAVFMATAVSTFALGIVAARTACASMTSSTLMRRWWMCRQRVGAQEAMAGSAPLHHAGHRPQHPPLTRYVAAARPLPWRRKPPMRCCSPRAATTPHAR